MKNKCYPILLILISLISITASGQVDLPTGRASYSLPLFNYSDGGRLSFNIALNYTGGGGIKVNQIPTKVGLGWDLFAGGMIVRRTIGVPDDQIGGTYGGIRQGDGYLAPNSYRGAPISLKAGYIPLFESTFNYQPDSDVLKDLQQDIFEFQFGGRSGSFIISGNGMIRPLDNSKLKIEKVEYFGAGESKVITTIGSFIITDESGIQYTFSESELTNLIDNKNGPYVSSLGLKITLPNYDVSEYAVKNTWYLSEIKDPISGKKITLKYDSYDLQYLIGYEAALTYTVADGQGSQGGQSIVNVFSGTKKRLSEITFPDYRTKVNLIYSDSDMVDLPGEKPLKQIIVKHDDEIISGHQFGYEYFFKDTTKPFNYTFTPSDLKFARLCLKSVQKTGKFNIPDAPYSFSYYNKVGTVTMAGRNLKCGDHWGYENALPLYLDYTNGDNAAASVKMLTNYIQQYRKVDPNGSSVIGALKAIQLPTGGKLLYEYENNTAQFNGSAVLSGGIRVQRTTLYDMVDTTKKIVKEYRYVNADGGSSGWGYEVPVYQDVSDAMIVVPPSQSGYRPGNLLFSVAMSPILPNLYAANSIGNMKGVQNMVMNQLFITIIVAIIIDILTPPPTTKQYPCTNTQELSTHSTKNNLLPHLYKRVEVLEGTSTSNIGKMVYDFTSPDDFPLAVPTQSQPYSPKTRCLPWVYGLIKKEQEISKASKTLSEKVYAYAPLTTEVGDSNVVWKPRNMLMCPNSLYLAFSTYYITFYSEIYKPLLGRTDLISIAEKNYDSIGNFSQASTTYINNSTNLLPAKINVVNSLGDTIQTRTYYPQDYNGASLPVLKALTDANCISLPVAQETWQLNPTGQKLLSSSLSVYKFTGAPDIKVEQIQSLETDVPVTAAAAGNFNSGVLNRTPALIKNQQIMSYDGAGNIVHLSGPATVETGYQWGNGDEFGNVKQKITAEITNAHAAHVERSGTQGAVTNAKLVLTDGNVKTATFTLAQAGTIFLQLDASPTGSSSMLSYTLSGGSPAISYSGTLCNVVNSGRISDNFNTFKLNFPKSVFYASLPAGTYTLTGLKSTYSGSCDFTYSYFTDPTVSLASEFLYEDFESGNYTGTIVPYAGKGCKEGDYPVSFTMPNSRSYRVDYRYYLSGKWNYNAKPYTNGMLLSDGDAIDEVRIYPVDAVISTYTYDPMIGLTSQTDVNGNTVFNEYDYLGRLSIVRDQDGNILKRICYNYFGQPETCGGKAYSNTALSKTFTKQGCGSGFIAGTGVYNIPVGKYTGDDSLMVNAMAQEDMRVNGQNYINQTTQCTCSGVDKKVINGSCITGVIEYFNEPISGNPFMCKVGYRYKFPDGTYGPKTYTGEEPCN
ncbi:DUF5977 domain-containing protein [Chitinophaga sp. ARDCPP14]|uniref:DUF5977 domain-containing protein n=1 Tax=Chitinophaga sp. ARDCPP14 TaxID=3391139 RepID=UPI003F51C2B3